VLTEREDLKTEPWDLEDIVLLGQDKKGTVDIRHVSLLFWCSDTFTACPYFGAKTLSYKADLVLCPYNYLLDPGIRESFKIELQGAVVIFDEAQYDIIPISMRV
jgi:Rad3-related DNA helicase